MKTMFIRESVNMTVDFDTNQVDSIPSAREAIQRIYVAPENMHIVYQSGPKKEETDVETGDIIVTFYTDDFDKRMIVVKSEDWKNNILSYEEKIRGAQKCCDASDECKCEACDACPSA